MKLLSIDFPINQTGKNFTKDLFICPKIYDQQRKDAFYKEVCICWENVGQVYAVETPLELKAIFETDADEVAKILPQYQKYGIELTAINYANH